MTDAIDCPHCLLRVLPTNGICPSCAKDANDIGAIARSRQERELAEIVEGLKRVRTSDAAVLDRVVAIGYEREAGVAVLSKRRAEVAAMRFEIMKMYLWPGYVALAIGLVVTVGTVIGGLHGMSTVMVWYGAIGYGMTSVGVGHLKLRRCPL